MWLPTFLQRGIHFFGERTQVLAFNNFVLFDRIHLPIIGKRAALIQAGGELPRQAGEIFRNSPDMKPSIPPPLITLALICFALALHITCH